MHIDLDRWHEVLATLGQNKLRTFLTACGVFWGILLLVIMLGFGKGLWLGAVKNMGGLTHNVVYVWGQNTSMPYAGFKPGRWVRLTTADIEPLRTEVPGVRRLAPRFEVGGWQQGLSVTRGEHQGNFTVVGDYPEFLHVGVFTGLQGRFINELDMRHRRKTAVIGQRVQEILFPNGEDPVGQSIQVRGVSFDVVGTLQVDLPGDDGTRANSTIHVPFPTAQVTFDGDERVGWFAIELDPTAPAAAVEQEVRDLLKRRRGVHPDDKQALGSYNSARDAERARRLFSGIRFFTWFVSIATLMAGLLGVSNIMLISVRERTKEFGVRKALGATPWSIVSLVIQESALLTLLAGYAGFVAGVGVLELATELIASGQSPLGPPSIEIGTGLIATLVIAVGGVVAGVAPARHAAAIRPVEALRAE